MQTPRIMVSAPHRSSGKTTMSIGLAAALSRRGYVVQPFKKGPDFIDPMWLTMASGRDCHNLDLFMMGEARINESFQRAGRDADICVIEGNMGLFDSTDIEGKGSSADLARQLRAPVILSVNTRNLTRSIAPLLLGYENFEPDIAIAGVILNKVSGPRHEQKLRAAIERYTDLEVLGAVRRNPQIGIIQRHLGLRPAREEQEPEKAIDAIATIVADSVDLDRVLAIAAGAPALEPLRLADPAAPEPSVRIGIAQDRAFTFYYPENLAALRQAGAELVPFSPLEDRSLPAGLNGLYIGGGFPEMFMPELEANAGLRGEIQAAVRAGMPVYAECGGLMYLARSMSWDDRRHEMTGCLPCDIVMYDKPRGHGYMQLESTGDGWFDKGLAVRGHEFHYSEVVDLGRVGFAYRVERGSGIDGAHDGIVHENVLASYTHLHSLGSDGWAEGFVEFIRRTGFNH
ncbi:MAG: cobyrinate a,c-diamide synthase [Thermoleophilia bacterium]